MAELPLRRTTQRSGDEPFRQGQVPLDFSVCDFWRWAYSDLLSNRERGILAEYLVARALDASQGVRAEWDAQDVVTPSGLKIEVKSAAYLQTWTQKGLSTISFDVARRRGWDAATDTYAENESRCADVYVFCVLVEKEPRHVDPLDLSQWRFWVVLRGVLDDQLGDQQTMGLSTLERIAGPPVLYDDLPATVVALRK
jgi:hypothetical protein